MTVTNETFDPPTDSAFYVSAYIGECFYLTEVTPKTMRKTKHTVNYMVPSMLYAGNLRRPSGDDIAGESNSVSYLTPYDTDFHKYGGVPIVEPKDAQKVLKRGRAILIDSGANINCVKYRNVKHSLRHF